MPTRPNRSRGCRRPTPSDAIRDRRVAGPELAARPSLSHRAGHSATKRRAGAPAHSLWRRTLPALDKRQDPIRSNNPRRQSAHALWTLHLVRMIRCSGSKPAAAPPKSGRRGRHLQVISGTRAAASRIKRQSLRDPCVWARPGAHRPQPHQLNRSGRTLPTRPRHSAAPGSSRRSAGRSCPTAPDSRAVPRYPPCPVPCTRP